MQEILLNETFEKDRILVIPAKEGITISGFDALYSSALWITRAV